ncbi:MAG TPA: TlpA disulfide reductase family protein [Chitinophaga sp.]|uniref:TlpA disulfide reductase family protein n=1 Tax=Chitinophaga sp. TaxID=1869181 RepID=UPI002DBEC4A0|nr:TlpA disulfide reductase family protein [Chitinophaga sp.]HEU4553875.1 TlpA disulfide reductase family protein [Chitinophaga sp.]
MKTLPLIAAVLLTGIWQHAAAQKGYVINGTLKNFAVPPPKVYMEARVLNKEMNAQKTLQVDSALVKNNHFRFTGTFPGLANVTLYGFRPKSNTGLQFVDQAAVHLQGGEMNIVMNGSFAKNTISGSGTRAELDYRDAMKKVLVLADSVRNIMQSEEAQTSPGMRIVFSQLLGDVMNLMISESAAYIKAHPASPIAPELLGTLITDKSTPSARVDSLIQLMPPATQAYVMENMKEGIAAKKAAEATKAAAEALTTLGTPAHDFTQQDVNGNQVRLSSFKGKYVLIDFWASWCGPCRAENPNVLKAYNRYKDKGFDILGVSLDVQGQEDAWKKAIEKDGLTWTQVWDAKGFDNAAAKLYGVSSIPQNFLVDPKGIIIAKNLRGDALEKKLAEVIK